MKGLSGVENSVVAVEESCVLDVKSRIPLIISSGRVVVLKLFFKSQVSVLQLKVPLSVFIVPKNVSRKHVVHVSLYFLHSWKKRGRRKSLLLQIFFKKL